jgi:hypothetical protein
MDAPRGALVRPSEEPREECTSVVSNNSTVGISVTPTHESQDKSFADQPELDYDMPNQDIPADFGPENSVACPMVSCCFGTSQYQVQYSNIFLPFTHGQPDEIVSGIVTETELLVASDGLSNIYSSAISMPGAGDALKCIVEPALAPATQVPSTPKIHSSDSLTVNTSAYIPPLAAASIAFEPLHSVATHEESTTEIPNVDAEGSHITISGSAINEEAAIGCSLSPLHEDPAISSSRIVDPICSEPALVTSEKDLIDASDPHFSEGSVAGWTSRSSDRGSDTPSSNEEFGTSTPLHNAIPKGSDYNPNVYQEHRQILQSAEFVTAAVDSSSPDPLVGSTTTIPNSPAPARSPIGSSLPGVYTYPAVLRKAIDDRLCVDTEAEERRNNIATNVIGDAGVGAVNGDCVSPLDGVDAAIPFQEHPENSLFCHIPSTNEITCLLEVL